jgi:ArsR family transcriptional regulator
MKKSELKNIHDSENTNLILDILGNSTRRRILHILSKEPLYFNQLAKIIGIGQQAILRHMKILEDSKLIEAYTKESNRGGPDRKYYRLVAAFSMNMTFSKDGLFFTNNKIKDSNYEEYKKFYKVYQKYILEYNNKKNKNFHKLGLLLDLLKNTLEQIEIEISNHESKINELYALRQIILDNLHQIGRDNFDFLERHIIYSFMQRISPTSIAELTHNLNENEATVKNSIKKLADKFKEDETSIFESLKKN